MSEHKVIEEVVPEHIEKAIEAKKLKQQQKQASGGSKKKKSQPEHNTFNQLDPRFQIDLKKHDPNHIFPEEYEMIKELRKRLPDLEFETDKFLVFFLCARRHDIEDTVELLEAHLKRRKELGVDKKWISLKDPRLQELIDEQVCVRLPNSNDKFGRGIYWFFMGKQKPGRDLDTMISFSFWETYLLLETETLATLRNGVIWVCDMEGWGMKNMDNRPEAKDMMRQMTGLFPNRIRGMYLINVGVVMRAAIAVAKWVLPKKLSERMHTLDVKNLTDIIPSEEILNLYGGPKSYDHEKGVEALVKIDKKLRQEHKERRMKRRQAKTEQLPTKHPHSKSKKSAEV